MTKARSGDPGRLPSGRGVRRAALVGEHRRRDPLTARRMTAATSGLPPRRGRWVYGIEVQLGANWTRHSSWRQRFNAVTAYVVAMTKLARTVRMHAQPGRRGGDSLRQG